MKIGLFTTAFLAGTGGAYYYYLYNNIYEKMFDESKIYYKNAKSENIKYEFKDLKYNIKPIKTCYDRGDLAFIRVLHENSRFINISGYY